MISVKVLRQCRLFDQLSLSALTELSEIGTEVSFKAREWLFHENDPADALYLIITGHVSLNLNAPNGHDVYIEFGTRTTGDIIGWSAVVRPYFYKLGARAISDTQLVNFEGTQLLGFIQNNPESGNLIMQGITQVAVSRMKALHARLGKITTG